MATFEDYLYDLNLAPRTVAFYERTARRWGDDDPVEWLRSNVNSQTPSGTANSLAAAVRHYCAWEDETTDTRRNPPLPDRLIPRLRRRQQTFREALNDEELEAYAGAIDSSATPEPVYTILKLLPRTGLRIAEICNLPRNALKKRGRSTGVTNGLNRSGCFRAHKTPLGAFHPKRYAITFASFVNGFPATLGT